MDMNKTLVAYFSCTGTTRRAAQALAALTELELFGLVRWRPPWTPMFTRFVRRSLIRPPIWTGEIRKAAAPSK